MLKVLQRARQRFARNQRGNVAVIFAFSAIPLVGLIGGAADMARYARHKQTILNAMDSAALALVRRGAATDAEADRFVNEFILAQLPRGKERDPMLRLARFDATDIGGGYRVSSIGSMETAFMPLIGIREMPLDLQSEVMRTNGKYEIALALDNTGSMDSHGRIEALRDAAGQLVTDLYAKQGARDRVKMALVPFVTAVNVKTPGVYDKSWIQPIAALSGSGTAGVAVDRLDLFKNRMNVEWKGCIEARLQDDETDAPPVGASTRWVPYLWPDEPDSGPYANSYLTDSGSNGRKPKRKGRGDVGDLPPELAKYDLPAGVSALDRTDFGPNAACPRPIVELTNDTGRLQREIKLMKPHNEGRYSINNSGTNVAQGLAWAWRVLSPDSPFDQGAPYEDRDTTKVLVLLSDGRNQIVRGDEDQRATQSDYTSFGYLADGRLGTTDNRDKAERAVDGQVKRICENAKEEGIRVYTILFQVDYEKTKDLFRDCASPDPVTGEPLYFYVPKPELLAAAFDEIGKDLTAIRISR